MISHAINDIRADIECGITAFFCFLRVLIWLIIGVSFSQVSML